MKLPRLRRAWRRRLVAAALVLAAAGGPASGADPEAGDTATGEPVDVELLLMVDTSASVSDNVLAFQLEGHAAALRDPAVAAAIEAGEFGAVAVALVGYSGPNSLEMLIPWTRLGDGAEAAALADRVAALARDAEPGSTAVGSAVAQGLALFGGNGYAGLRRVIDLTGNGFSNAGLDPEVARRRAEAAGVTVNALAILNDYDWLEGYYRDAVVAGPAGFAMAAMDRAGFVAALTRKLVREIGPVS